MNVVLIFFGFLFVVVVVGFLLKLGNVGGQFIPSTVHAIDGRMRPFFRALSFQERKLSVVL